MEITKNIGLIKEGENEPYDVNTVNANLDKIDEEFGKIGEITPQDIAAWYAGGTDVPEIPESISHKEIDEMYETSSDYGEGDVGIPNRDIDGMYHGVPDYGEGDVGIPNREIDNQYAE